MDHDKPLKEHLNDILGARDNMPEPNTPWGTLQSERANDRQVGGTHYKNMDVSPWDVVDTWPYEQRIGFYRGNALKYIMRLGSKDQSDQEASKGLHYLEKLVEVLKEQP